MAPSGADAAAHGDILQCRCSGTRLTEACQRNSGTRPFCMGKEALTSHGQRIASESPVIFSNKLSQARALFSLRLRMRTLRHTDAYQGGTLIQGTHALIHNCSADAMAHGSRWWRRCYGTRSQMVAQMERQKEKRERERERCNNTARCSGTRMQ